MKKTLKVILIIIISSLIFWGCIIGIKYYLRDFFGINAKTVEQLEEILSDNIDCFENNAATLVKFKDDLDIVNSKYLSGYIKRDDWNYYDIKNNLTVISMSNKALTEENLKSIKNSECKRIIKKMRFRRISIFDSCVYYMQTANLSCSVGLLYCTQKETVRERQSSIYELGGWHIKECKHIKDNWYYVQID